MLLLCCRLGGYNFSAYVAQKLERAINRKSFIVNGFSGDLFY